MTTKTLTSMEKRATTGQRNLAAHKLAYAYKQNGLTEENALKRMSTWNERNTNVLPQAEIDSIIRSIFKK